MNLQKLFKVQAELDKKIVKEKGLEGQDLLDKKILALQVELGELANEIPEEFKFWANKYNDRERALKEYIDCIHFSLSIGNDFGYSIKDTSKMTVLPNVVRQLNATYKAVSRFNVQRDEMGYKAMMWLLLGLGFLLSFTWDEIEKVYFEKNKINHERQENGY